jgi:hypothetical protein
MPGNAGGAEGPDFWCAFEDANLPRSIRSPRCSASSMPASCRSMRCWPGKVFVEDDGHRDRRHRDGGQSRHGHGTDCRWPDLRNLRQLRVALYIGASIATAPIDLRKAE